MAEFLRRYPGSRRTAFSTISDWESGESEPRLTQLAILAKAFNRPMSYFVKRR